MCGRFTIFASDVELAERYGVKISKYYQINYNAAPGQQLPLILNEKSDKLVLGKWGLKPVWQKNDPKNTGLINTRADSLITKNSFKPYFGKKHCLVPVNGFFEWQQTNDKKNPYFIGLKNKKLFSLAGIWDLYKNQDGEVRPMFSIITTEPNMEVVKIHHRMPIILKEEDEKKWLDTKQSSEEILKLLKPYPNQILETYPISKLVNSPQNNKPEILYQI